MRANLPKQPPTSLNTDLSGDYLSAMQEISVRLMDALPAGEELWQTLGQAEAMLLEAQHQGMPVGHLFGKGGVSSFCQSILDEYHAEHSEGQVGQPPASQDPSIKSHAGRNGSRKAKDPRRGRRLNLLLTSVAVALVASLALWYLGVFNYWWKWCKGEPYYIEELHNFKETVTVVQTEPIRLEIPLEQAFDLGRVLYDDGTYKLILHEVNYDSYPVDYVDSETQEKKTRTNHRWFFTVLYTVRSDFCTVSYIEPDSQGSIQVTLPDGSIHMGDLGWLSSGVYGDGMELVRFSILDVSGQEDVKGGKVMVQLGPLRLVRLDRISTGPR